MNAVLGFLLVIAAGALNGSFALPMKRTSRWAWENTWLVYSIVGMVVVNWAVACATVPQLGSVYARAGLAAVAMVFAFGLLWGIANVMFGLGIDLIGISLSVPITIGLSAALGSLIPMARRPEVFATPGGIATTLGIVVMLAGVAVYALAGIRRDAQVAAHDDASRAPAGRAARRRLLQGLALVTISGLLDPWQNFALVFGDRIKQEVAVAGGAAGAGADAIWTLNLSAGCLVTVAYCGFLLFRNGTWSRFWREGTSSHWGFAALMGLIWMLSITLYGRGAERMGPLGESIGWAVFYGCIVISSTAWGVVAGEWRGGEGRPLRTLLAALAVLLAAVVILAYANVLPVGGGAAPSAGAGGPGVCPHPQEVIA